MFARHIVRSGDVRSVLFEKRTEVHCVRYLPTQGTPARTHAQVAVFAHQMTTLRKHDRAWLVQAHATLWRVRHAEPGDVRLGRPKFEPSRDIIA